MRAALAIAAKDLRIEWRNRTAFATAVVFAVLVLLVFVFARDSGSVSAGSPRPDGALGHARPRHAS